jgi:hypothetical protein
MFQELELCTSEEAGCFVANMKPRVHFLESPIEDHDFMGLLRVYCMMSSGLHGMFEKNGMFSVKFSVNAKETRKKPFRDA